MGRLIFSDKLLLTNTQTSRFHKAFANDLSANIKSSKTQLQKIAQSRGFLRTITKNWFAFNEKCT